MIYPASTPLAGGTLPRKGPGSPCWRCCCPLDLIIITEMEEVEVAAPLAGEEGGAARSGDTVPP